MRLFSGILLGLFGLLFVTVSPMQAQGRCYPSGTPLGPAETTFANYTHMTLVISLVDINGVEVPVFNLGPGQTTALAGFINESWCMRNLDTGYIVLAGYVYEDRSLFTVRTHPQPNAPPPPPVQPSPTPADRVPSAPPVATPAALPGGGVYQLAYTKWDGGNHNLYVADTNGDNEQFLLSRAAGPSWTPDGRQIFFYGEEAVDRQTRDTINYVIDGISNGIVALDAIPLPTTIDALKLYQPLTWKQGTARYANVSPLGDIVAFDATFSGNFRIYYVGVNEGDSFPHELIGEQVDWSPDGQQVVYRSGRDGHTGLWIANPNDTGHTPLTYGGSDSFPVFSPDGQTIAFSRDEGGNVDIYTVDRTGQNLYRLTDNAGIDTLPAFTPSGDIIFRTTRAGRWSIWKMQSNGSDPVEVIYDAPVGPDWAYSKMDVH